MACAILGAFLVSAASAATNLITNGSFELNPNGPGAYSFYYTGSTAITGWTVVGSNVAIHNGSFFQPAAADLTYYLDLSGQGGLSAGGVFQTFATNVGTQYDLSFSIGAFLASGPWINFQVNDSGNTSLLNQTLQAPWAGPGPVQWTSLTYNFTATTALTTLRFFDTSGFDNNATFVDRVSVTEVRGAAVPESSATLVLSLVGFLGIFATRRFLSEAQGVDASHEVIL